VWPAYLIAAEEYVRERWERILGPLFRNSGGWPLIQTAFGSGSPDWERHRTREFSSS
jgi:hypothetical protein